MPIDRPNRLSPHSFNRRSFLKTAGVAALAAPFVTSELVARPPNSVLLHASFGASGQAWADIKQLALTKRLHLVAVAEVDVPRAAEVKRYFPRARIYQDWRLLLEREGKQIDSVNISVQDHMHGVMTMTAMRMGKHVYCQKPLTHDLYETRRLTEQARWKGVVTQMGIQMHSASFYQMAVLLLQAGTIGRVKELHCWSHKGWGDPSPRPDVTDPVPEGFDWNGWLGVCATRPFIGKEYYHPTNWRKRLDFGCGTLGDMGCHILDPVFGGLGLSAPLSVRSEGPAPNQWNWASNSCIHYTFPGTAYTADKTLPLTWYDGQRRPDKAVIDLLEGDPLPPNGSIFIGTQGVMLLPHYGRPMFYPDKKFKDMRFPDVADASHWGIFVDACLNGTRTNAGFDYSGPLTEAVLVGTIATRFPQTTLNWDSAHLTFRQGPANAFIRRPYRNGWTVRGLA